MTNQGKLETSCEHFIKIFNKMQDERIKLIEVTQDACDDYLYHMHTFHKNTVWEDSYRSWYKKNGKVWIWPGVVGFGIPRLVSIDSG